MLKSIAVTRVLSYHMVPLFPLALWIADGGIIPAAYAPFRGFMAFPGWNK